MRAHMDCNTHSSLFHNQGRHLCKKQVRRHAADTLFSQFDSFLDSWVMLEMLFLLVVSAGWVGRAEGWSVCGRDGLLQKFHVCVLSQRVFFIFVGRYP